MRSRCDRRPSPFALFLLPLALAAPGACGPAAAQTAPPVSPPAAQSQDEALGESYVEGSTYAGGARIALDASGHVFSVQAGSGRMADFGDAPLFVVLATVSGPTAPWEFSFGDKDGGITLLVDGKRYAPIEAQFAAQVVAPVEPGARPERARRRADGATVVVDTTEHPLAILFRLPGKALRSPQKTLSLRGFEIAGKRYNFDLRFAD
jgi:hypothetical protein